MKIRQQDNIVLSNSNTGEHSFGFKASAKAFQILSSSIYSRKIEAIVRELSCNAYDSHVQAGCPDRPFIVNIPNEWESEFSVEDFGVGLSHDEVMHVYTTYFESTKTNSNDVIGGLGLGSKTPFAYTDSFNVRARKDGVESTYNAYINSEGMPAISLLTSHPTEEPNGVKVTVPVRSSDRYAFFSDCVNVHRWFTIPPTYTGSQLAPDVSNPTLEALNAKGYIIVNASNAHRLTNSYSYANYVRVLMGNVSYLVSNITSQFGSVLTKAEETFFSNNAIVVKFNIGDLDVAASRETISFDDVTTKVFFDKIRECVGDGIDEVQKTISTMSFIEAIYVAEREMGPWAAHWLDYKGEPLSDMAELKIVDVLEDVLGEGSLNPIARTRASKGRPITLRYSTCTVRTIATGRHRKIAIAVGTQRGYNKIMRDITRIEGVYMTFSVDSLTDQQRDDLVTKLCDSVMFFDVDKIIEEEKAERRRLAAERRKALMKNSAGVSQPKMTVAEARVAALFKLEKGVLSVEKIDSLGMLIEAEDIVGRFAVLPVSRNIVSGPLNQSFNISEERSTIKKLMRIHRIDTLIIAKPSQQKKLDKVINDANLEAVDLQKQIEKLKFDTEFVMKIYIRQKLRSYKEAIIEDYKYTWIDDVNPDWANTPDLDFIHKFDAILNDHEVEEYRHGSIYGFTPISFIKSVEAVFDATVYTAKDAVWNIAKKYTERYPLLASDHSRIWNSDLKAYIEAMDRLHELEAKFAEAA